MSRYEPDPFERFRKERNAPPAPLPGEHWREELARKIMSGEVRIIGDKGQIVGTPGFGRKELDLGTRRG